MSKIECSNCKNYINCLNLASAGIEPLKRGNTCKGWEIDRTDEELEAQRVDAAERENHRKEVEGDEIE